MAAILGEFPSDIVHHAPGTYPRDLIRFDYEWDWVFEDQSAQWDWSVADEGACLRCFARPSGAASAVVRPAAGHGDPEGSTPGL